MDMDDLDSILDNALDEFDKAEEPSAPPAALPSLDTDEYAQFQSFIEKLAPALAGGASDEALHGLLAEAMTKARLDHEEQQSSPVVMHVPSSSSSSSSDSSSSSSSSSSDPSLAVSSPVESAVADVDSLSTDTTTTATIITETITDTATTATVTTATTTSKKRGNKNKNPTAEAKTPTPEAKGVSPTPEAKGNFNSGVEQALRDLASPKPPSADPMADLMKGLPADAGLEDMLKNVLASFGSEEGAPELDKMMESIVGEMFSKENMEGPLREILSKYPPWIEKNKHKLTPTELKNYQNQHDCFLRMLASLEAGQPATHMTDLLNEMQNYGQPPEEITGPNGNPFGGANPLGGPGMPELSPEEQEAMKKMANECPTM